MENIDMRVNGYLSINTDESGRAIVGYTTSGGRGEQDIMVHKDILPSNFFSEFAMGKFKYYRETGEVIEDYNFVPPSLDTPIEEPPQETVSKEDFDNLKEQFDQLQKLLEQLLGGKA